MRSLFIFDPKDLYSPILGGVQLCSQEFLDIVGAASEELELVPVSVTDAPIWRLRRLFGLGSYLFYRPKDVREVLVKAAASIDPTHIFLNRSELIRIAPLVAELAPHAKIVVMSHGNQSGDDLYEVAGPGGARKSKIGRIKAMWQLGLDLANESRYRHRYLDAVCVMSEEEEILERWLGATTTVVLPRIIKVNPLTWEPIFGRIGFVGTLNHTPNRIALERLCDHLSTFDASNLEFRLVGGPDDVGRALATKYSFVVYLGKLNDEMLQREAASWTLFLNPIFWLSRGASMKLGQSLSWAIPALTTRAGARGYQLTSDQSFITGDSVEAFTATLLDVVHSSDQLSKVRNRLLRSAEDWPNVQFLASRLKSILD
ncbi:MAG: glycosyltransferase [Chthoniobacterales bacterium]